MLRGFGQRDNKSLTKGGNPLATAYKHLIGEPDLLMIVIVIKEESLKNSSRSEEPKDARCGAACF